MSEVVAKKSAPPVGYGIWVFRCPCGWWTLGKGRKAPEACEACNHPVSPHNNTSAEWREDVACAIATYTDFRSDRMYEHAKGAGLFVQQLSARRYVVLREDGATSVKFGNGTGRAYLNLKTVCGPTDYQSAMKYVRDNSPELPAYLLPK